MKKFWLYLESFTMVFPGIQGHIFFNSVSNHSFLVSSNEKLLVPIIEQLLKPKNMYSIEVSEADIDKYGLWDLIKRLRETYMGDLYPQEIIRKKPVALYPKLSIMKSVRRLKIHPENSVGQNLLYYLQELNIFINGNCSVNCQFCELYKKQVTTCIKNNDELNIAVLNGFLKSTSSTGLNKINILGGDIFNHSQWKDLYKLINDLPLKVCLFSHYQNILMNAEKIDNLSNNITFIVIIPFGFTKAELVEVLKLFIINNRKYELIFYIASDFHNTEVEMFCKKNNINVYSVLPVFTTFNETFFNQNVLLDSESILEIPTSKKMIFSRMALNTNDFGKLNIMSNGDVFANLNFQKLGNIRNSSIYEVLYSEFFNGKSWFRIRDHKPCNQCVYQWLCPSPSNYELEIGKPNLCHVL